MLGASLEALASLGGARSRDPRSEPERALRVRDRAPRRLLPPRRHSLLAFFGGSEQVLETDITVTTGDVAHARDLGCASPGAGVPGAQGQDQAARPSSSISNACSPSPRRRPRHAWCSTATRASAPRRRSICSLGLERLAPRLALFEQPTAAEDHEGSPRFAVTAGSWSPPTRAPGRRGRGEAREPFRGRRREHQDHQDRHRRGPRHDRLRSEPRARSHGGRQWSSPVSV